MTKLKQLLALSAMLVATAAAAHADSISGTISIAGKDTFTPTSITFSPTTGVVLSSSGTMAGYGPTATLTSFSFATTTSAAGVTLFSVGEAMTSNVESFVLSTVSVVTYLTNFLDITGTGTFYETGYSPTFGSFTLTSSTAGTTSFEFDAMAAQAPEPSSLLLLGTGLVGAAGMLFRRRRNTNSTTSPMLA